MNIHPSRFDAETFHHLAVTGRARIADGDLHGGRDQLRDALVLWRGRAYEQFEDAFWARRAIMRLDAERLAALTARIDADLAIADIDVIGELEALMIDEPQHDGVCARLMLALYRSGRHADALSAYRRHIRRLGERSGLAPSPALRQLERQILQHDAALANERDRIGR